MKYFERRTNTSQFHFTLVLIDVHAEGLDNVVEFHALFAIGVIPNVVPGKIGVGASVGALENIRALAVE